MLTKIEKEADRLGIASRRASAVRGGTLEWVWPGRFALGRVHVLDGDPGLGKSTIALDIAARLSRGLPMPTPQPTADEEKPYPRAKPDPNPHPAMTSPTITPLLGRSIIISAEDNEQTALQPRLVAAGADLEQIEIVDEVNVPTALGGVLARPVLLPDDVPEFERLIRGTEAQLLIVDPIMAFIGHDRRGRPIDAHKDQSVRQMMYPLRRLAERTGVCIILIRHLTKSLVASAIRRGLASIGIAAAARSVLMAAEHPRMAGVRALAGVKTNLGFMAPTFTYRMVASKAGAPRIEWIDECDYTADDLLQRVAVRTPSRQREAEMFLKELLEPGPMAAVEVMARTSARGLSEGTLNRAAKRLGVNRLKTVKTWMWELPARDECHLEPLQ
jgi:hypothetical protein